MLLPPTLSSSSLLLCSYGLKDVEGVHRLTGPGLEADDLPGVVSGGGKWPKRWYNYTSPIS